MAAVWILLGKTKYPARLLQSSIEHGVVEAEIPFDIAMDFVPALLKEADARIVQQSAGDVPIDPAFADILHQSQAMDLVLSRARRVAIRALPVLIEGESGTGKELLARAIHKASPRADKAMVVLNCGAIPPGLVESTLFGHVEGAFTGAVREHTGCFEEADGSTLFLDEIGELPLEAQVTLLRVLQAGEVTKVGASTARRVDVRVIAATNRSLLQESAAGRFREDLFYRLAVAVLFLPPLREREGDLSLLIDAFLQDINEGAREAEPGYEPKTLSAGAQRLLLTHRWPGNVRELRNTLERATLWATSPTILEDDLAAALFTHPAPDAFQILERPLNGDFSLEETIAEVAAHYLERALDLSGGNRSKAARLVGFHSYQRFDKWTAKYKVS